MQGELGIATVVGLLGHKVGIATDEGISIKVEYMELGIVLCTLLFMKRWNIVTYTDKI
jgi:hypothetical protein